jgi:hypothetical protein
MRRREELLFAENGTLTHRLLVQFHTLYNAGHCQRKNGNLSYAGMFMCAHVHVCICAHMSMYIHACVVKMQRKE